MGTFAKALPLPLMALVWGKQGGSRNRQTAALAGPRPMLVWCVCVCVCVCVPTTGRRGGQQGVGVLVGKMMCTRGKGCVFCVRTQGCVQGWTLLCLYTHTHTRTHTHTLSLSVVQQHIWRGEGCVFVYVCTGGACVQDRGGQIVVCQACPRSEMTGMVVLTLAGFGSGETWYVVLEGTFCSSGLPAVSLPPGPLPPQCLPLEGAWIPLPRHRCWTGECVCV